MNNISLQRLKKYREEKGYSQEKLALISGVSKRTIQRIETGAKCTPETASILADALGVENIDDLIENKRKYTIDEIAVLVSSATHPASRMGDELTELFLNLIVPVSIPVSILFAAFATFNSSKVNWGAGSVILAIELAFIATVIVAATLRKRRRDNYNYYAVRSELNKHALSEAEFASLQKSEFLNTLAAAEINDYLFDQKVKSVQRKKCHTF